MARAHASVLRRNRCCGLWHRRSADDQVFAHRHPCSPSPSPSLDEEIGTRSSRSLRESRTARCTARCTHSAPSTHAAPDNLCALHDPRRRLLRLLPVPELSFPHKELSVSVPVPLACRRAQQLVLRTAASDADLLSLPALPHQRRSRSTSTERKGRTLLFALTLLRLVRELACWRARGRNGEAPGGRRLAR